MILMNDFKAEPFELREAMLVAARRVLESGWYVLGNEVLEFEKKWSEACGVAHGVGVGNGMDAIEIASNSIAITSHNFSEKLTDSIKYGKYNVG